MIPVLLFMLCVPFAGSEQDCSYTWEMVPSLPNPLHAGETDPNNKTVTAVDIPTLTHEVKHVQCFLNHPQGEQRNQCNQLIDNNGITTQLQDNTPITPRPPMYNEKHYHPGITY